MTEANLHVVAGLGPVGRAVIDEVLSRGLPVRAITRDHGPDLPVGVEIVQADITDLVAARRAMAGAAGDLMAVALRSPGRWPTS